MTRILLSGSGEPIPAPPPGLPLWRAGFRPFFLAGGVWAVLAMLLWLLILSGVGHGVTDRVATISPMLWHGHEMLYGFTAAVICGFLLTAVPNWTGCAGVRGGRLRLLAGLWLGGRLSWLLLLSGLADGTFVPLLLLLALPDLAFLPVLAGLLAGPLRAQGKWRNMAFVPLLLLLAGGNLLVWADVLGLAEGSGQTGLFLSVTIILQMIAVIGGRIIPGFTRNGLRMVGVTVEITDRPRLSLACLIVQPLGLAGLLLAPVGRAGELLVAALLLLAAGLQLARLLSWQGWHTRQVPLLWVLHAGYLALPAGLAVLGLAEAGTGLSPLLGWHALMVGSIGVMTVGVISRAALGHSGRALRPAPQTVAAYGCLLASAVVRVGLVPLLPQAGLLLSGALWCAGFALFVAVYAPICWKARIDGMDG